MYATITGIVNSLMQFVKHWMTVTSLFAKQMFRFMKSPSEFWKNGEKRTHQMKEVGRYQYLYEIKGSQV